MNASHDLQQQPLQSINGDRLWASLMEMAQIGATLRVLCATNGARDDIAASLRRAGIDAQLRDGEANLEDVFVAVTRKPLQART